MSVRLGRSAGLGDRVQRVIQLVASASATVLGGARPGCRSTRVWTESSNGGVYAIDLALEAKGQR
jgi:hypothetical protein